jgi:ABC-type lipoprotein export system ATPase subunit
MTTPSNNLIELSGVTKSYQTEERVVQALSGVDLSVERGQFLAIVGRSGCGKSTLLNLLGGLDKPSGGAVSVDGQNAALPALLAGTKKDVAVQRAQELLIAIGLEARLHQQASLLSGGEMQRVAVVRALINDPPLVLADEPTGNLDSKSAEAVLGALRQITGKGKTVVMVTHSREAASIADLTKEMRDGVFID